MVSWAFLVVVFVELGGGEAGAAFEGVDGYLDVRKYLVGKDAGVESVGNGVAFAGGIVG